MADPLPPKWVMSFMDGPLHFEWAYTSFFQVRSVQRRGNKYQLLASYKLHRNILDDRHTTLTCKVSLLFTQKQWYFCYSIDT